MQNDPSHLSQYSARRRGFHFDDISCTRNAKVACWKNGVLPRKNQLCRSRKGTAPRPGRGRFGFRPGAKLLERSEASLGCVLGPRDHQPRVEGSRRVVGGILSNGVSGLRREEGRCVYIFRSVCILMMRATGEVPMVTSTSSPSYEKISPEDCDFCKELAKRSKGFPDIPGQVITRMDLRELLHGPMREAHTSPESHPPGSPLSPSWPGLKRRPRGEHRERCERLTPKRERRSVFWGRLGFKSFTCVWEGKCRASDFGETSRAWDPPPLEGCVVERAIAGRNCS